MKRLISAVILAALAWFGFWFYSASVQKSAIENWFAQRRAAGWVADYTDLAVRGFPNRLDTTLTAPRLGDPNAGLIWETPFLQIFRLTYKPGHLIAVTAHDQTFSTPTAEYGVTTTDLRASLRLQDIAQWVPLRFILSAQGLDIQSTADLSLSADTAQLALERMEDRHYRMAIDVTGLTTALPTWLATSGAATTRFDRLDVNIDMMLSAPLNRATLETARPQPRALTLTLAEADWHGWQLAAAGHLNVTPSGTPEGQITLKLRNWQQMIAKERQTGKMSAAALDRIEFTLALISGLSGNPETLDLPFDFKNGRVWLGPLLLGKAPSLRLP